MTWRDRGPGEAFPRGLKIETWGTLVGPPVSPGLGHSPTRQTMLCSRRIKITEGWEDRAKSGTQSSHRRRRERRGRFARSGLSGGGLRGTGRALGRECGGNRQPMGTEARHSESFQFQMIKAQPVWSRGPLAKGREFKILAKPLPPRFSLEEAARLCCLWPSGRPPHRRHIGVAPPNASRNCNSETHCQ